MNHNNMLIIQQPWLQFKRPFVRDLAFALACPDALKFWTNLYPKVPAVTIEVHEADFWHKNFEQYKQRLSELDTTTQYQVLTRYLMSRPSPYRLGFHFEGLLHFWLEDGYRLNIHPYEVLAHNIQLYRDKQTVGELDFIVRNHATNDVEHWELAIKFYLGSPPYAFANWVGINSRDTLARKMRHMQSKQFGSVWVDIDRDTRVKIDKRFAIIKGRFFRPNLALPYTSFIKPSWLANHFPLHTWHAIKNANDVARLDISNIRPAHYIEWFTIRPFYHQRSLYTLHTPHTPYTWVRKPVGCSDNHKIKGQSGHNECHGNYKYDDMWQRQLPLLTFEDLKTNLYVKHSQPVVLVVDN